MLTKSRHMVAASNRQETHKWDLHARQCSQRIPRRVAHVQSGAESSHTDEHKGVQWEQVGNEDVSTPSADHVAIEQSRQRSPYDAAFFHGLDPQIKGKDEQEDSDGLVIVRASDTSADVSRGNTHENSREQSRRRIVTHFRGQKICCKCGQAREGRCEKHTDVANVDGHGEEAQHVVNGAGGDH